MKKLIAIALSAAVLALGLVGCGGQESSHDFEGVRIRNVL